VLSREEEVFLEVARYQAALFLPVEGTGPDQRSTIEQSVDGRSRWIDGEKPAPGRPTDPDRLDELRRRYREQRGRRNAERR
jgi:hypothetical protein